MSFSTPSTFSQGTIQSQYLGPQECSGSTWRSVPSASSSSEAIRTLLFVDPGTVQYTEPVEELEHDGDDDVRRDGEEDCNDFSVPDWRSSVEELVTLLSHHKQSPPKPTWTKDAFKSQFGHIVNRIFKACAGGHIYSPKIYAIYQGTTWSSKVVQYKLHKDSLIN